MHVELDPRRLVLIIVGAALRAEQTDRPLAYSLRADMERWIRSKTPEGGTPARQAVVCSDVWYLNHDSLRGVPTVTIGAPAINALSAFAASRLPAVFRVDGRCAVQMDLDLRDLVVCCWGVESDDTAAAVGAFRERYFADFMRAAVHA